MPNVVERREGFLMKTIIPDELYEEYKSRDDIKKIINEKEYTRIAGSEIVSIANRKLFMIYIDKSVNCRIGDLIEDENGNHFTIESVAHFNFGANPAPKWYYNMPYIQISSHETDSIGEYVIVCK